MKPDAPHPSSSGCVVVFPDNQRKRLRRVRSAVRTAITAQFGSGREEVGSLLLEIDPTGTRLWIDAHTFVEVAESGDYNFRLGTIESAEPLLSTRDPVLLVDVLHHYTSAVIEAALAPLDPAACATRQSGD